MKVLTGISGGFDSAYSVLRLREEGYTVEGAVLDMHSYTEIEEAKALSKVLDIPLHVISCREAFEKNVIEDFCHEYLCARTPNPCIRCNETVKFRVLFDYAMECGFDRIATGHYANITEREGRYAVALAQDARKDQSYMLYRLPAEILARLLFPMGHIIKKEAKEEQRSRDLALADREDSQEICFVKNENYADYIERRCGKSPAGEFVTMDGEVLGHHAGIVRYTVGQRKGLGISAASRLFIQRIDLDTNRIYLSDSMPSTRIFALKDVVFSGLTQEEALCSDTLRVRVRYAAPMIRARFFATEEGFFGELCDTATCAVTPGQSAVFYDGNTIALGGIIEKLVF